MQRLFIAGLGFAVVALCALPALAEEAAPAAASAPSSDMVSTAEQISQLEPAMLELAHSAVPEPQAVPAGYFSYDKSDFEADFSEQDFSLDCDSSTRLAQNAQLDCLGEELSRGCLDWDSPFSGQITYRMQLSGASANELGNFQQGVRFDLRYREWLSENLVVNLEIGSRDSSVFDVISGRHGGEARLDRAYVEGHFGESE